MSALSDDLARLHAAVARAHPGHPEGIYAVPWYLVVGDPGAGRTTALHAMSLHWREGADRSPRGAEACTYWMPEEGVFLEPQALIVGPQRDPERLGAFCDTLRRARPREPVDGLLLVINIASVLELDWRGTLDYGARLRRTLVEIGTHLRADVPTYVILTRYDTLWGFAEVFEWSAARASEEPWGFTLPADTPIDKALPQLLEGVLGLKARLSATCLAKLCGDGPVDARIRAFQHLCEVRELTDRLGALFRTIAAETPFERTPWVRAVVLGSALPGTGDRPRVGMARFFNMGLVAPPPVAGARPGGLPMHTFLERVVLPERDIVPLRTRWSDDRGLRLAFAIAAAVWVTAGIGAVVRALVR